MRVFFVAQTQARIDSIMQAMKDESIAQYFRFARLQDLEPTRALTEKLWQTVKGERLAVLKTA